MLTVVCKATYVLMPGESPLAPEQEEPNEADGYWNDEETRSLNFASDLAPFKRRADVLVVGHAFAPQRRPVSSLVARLVVGEVDKAIAVFGDRVWTGSGELREPSRFTKMPLRWERTAGGPRTTNPVGVRMGDVGVDHSAMIVLPNLQSTAGYLVSSADVLEPVGFGPIAPWWPGRAEKLHRHAAAWDPARWSERPLPDDVDAAFFNVAPEDQQLAEIRGDERIVLENLHADHARLVTSLAPVEPRAVVTRAGASAAVRLRCDTLWIDTDRGVCSRVWRGQVMLTRPDEAGQVRFSAEDWKKDDGVTTVIGGVVGSALLPFGSGTVANGDDDGTMPTVMKPLGSGLSSRERSPWAAPPTTALTSDDDGTGTVVGFVMLGQVMPFAESAQRLVEVSPLSPPPLIHAPSLVSSEPALDRSLQTATQSPTTPAPPAMIGPLAVIGGLVIESPPPAPTVATIAAIPAPTTPEAEPAPNLLSIERFSAILAELAEKRVSRQEVLASHDLTERDWTANEQRWAAALQEETTRGSSKLRAIGDRAYVAAVEGFRGPITALEYAALVIALERRRADAALDDLKIQRPALMRVIRLWTKKLATDGRISDEVCGALTEMRGS